MKLFKRYLNEKEQKDNSNEDNNGNISNKSFKEVIYKTFAKSIDRCKELKNEEKNEMKNIVDILVYLEMRKIELKMNYFRQFERLLEYKKTQLKTIETQIIQERIKLITKKLLLQKKTKTKFRELFFIMIVSSKSCFFVTHLIVSHDIGT